MGELAVILAKSCRLEIHLAARPLAWVKERRVLPIRETCITVSLQTWGEDGGCGQERRRQPFALLKTNIMPPLTLLESTLTCIFTTNYPGGKVEYRLCAKRCCHSWLGKELRSLPRHSLLPSLFLKGKALCLSGGQKGRRPKATPEKKGSCRPTRLIGLES